MCVCVKIIFTYYYALPLVLCMCIYTSTVYVILHLTVVVASACAQFSSGCLLLDRWHLTRHIIISCELCILDNVIITIHLYNYPLVFPSVRSRALVCLSAVAAPSSRPALREALKQSVFTDGQWACVYTVEPLNKGHLGTRASVLYSEVSFIRRLEMY